MLDPAQVSGTVIIVPLLNIPSFEQKVPHVNPVDGKSMNRFYPGNPNGTQTERASWAMTMQVVEKSDYLIDLHGGDLDESLRPYSYWAPTGNAQQDTVSQIRQFMDQSKEALAGGDMERAHTLAWKAQLLSEDLVKPPK